MGRVYLCLGKNAEVPYYFERARAHVWNIEELCYFLRENAWLLEPSLFGRELTDWVAKQCALPDLSRMLYAASQEEKPVMGFVKVLFRYTGYCTMEEADQVEKILKLNESTGAYERTKARGDYFLENKKFVLALQEYESLLQELKGMDPSFLGKVYHNSGVAQAQLFLFEKAASSFEQAWKLTGSGASARQFLAAKRLALGEQEYVAFLAEHPDLYDASLGLEEQVQRCSHSWKQSEDAVLVLHATEALKDGAAHICRQMVKERTELLKEQYRSCVMR